MDLKIYSSWFYNIYVKVISTLGNFNWKTIKTKITGKRYYNLTDADRDQIQSYLTDGYYVIVSRRNTFLSTYMVEFANLVKTGKLGHWSHVLFNLEGDNPETTKDFKLFEATSNGVHSSMFDEVFDCDSVALLMPKNITFEEWQDVVESVKSQVGHQYDYLFNLSDGSRVSCVELVREALQTIPGYETKFANLEAMIKKAGNLTPQMYYDCEDFKVVFEVRR